MIYKLKRSTELCQRVSPLSQQRCAEHKLNTKSSASVEHGGNEKEAFFYLLSHFPDVPDIEIILTIIINHLLGFRWEQTSVIAGFAETKESGTAVCRQL